ncbi:MAG: MarR family transcriptional regulator [Rhizobium sp.]|jgi:DNA-binding MarR family transcriptional regulator|nr:MarR family transcriptional regulator [Rhizobium sp.]
MAITTKTNRRGWEPLGEASFGFLLVHSAHGWVRCLEQALRPMALTHLQFSLMAATALLHQQGEIPHQGRLADFTGFDRMMVSKSMQLLLGKTLLKRSKHPTIARAYHIDLTAKGRSTLDAARPLYDAAIAQYFGSIDKKRLVSMGNVLRDLLERHDAG